jgi:hypothetical protein
MVRATHNQQHATGKTQRFWQSATLFTLLFSIIMSRFAGYNKFLEQTINVKIGFKSHIW